MEACGEVGRRHSGVVGGWEKARRGWAGNMQGEEEGLEEGRTGRDQFFKLYYDFTCRFCFPLLFESTAFLMSS